MQLLKSVFLVSFVLASSGAKKIDLNKEVDLILEHSNKAKKNHRFLNISTGEIAMLGLPTVDFAEGVLLGLNSLKRTANCSKLVEGTKKTFNIQIGHRLLVFGLSKVSIRGVPMSAFVRVGDNSFNFTYTIHDEKTCELMVNALKFERFQNILFGSSRTDFEGTDVNHMFQNGIRKRLNEWLDTLRPEIERRLRFRCRIPIFIEEIPSTDVTEAFLSLIEDIAIF